MKIITGTRDGQTVAGWVDDDEVVICATGPAASGAVLEMIAGGDAARAEWAAKVGPRVPLADIRLLAPIPEPRRDIFCVGKNYYAHAAEFHKSGFDSSAKEQVPSAPVIFTKATTSVIGPGETVRASIDPTASVDYEGELAVVIGKRTFGVSKAQAMDHVFGYVIVNDVTSRELQKLHNQWVIGKGCDTFCPMGPWIATADEVGDPDGSGPHHRGQRRAAPAGEGERADLRHPHADRDAVADDHASARRHHRDGHAGRCGHRVQPAGLPQARRPDARVDHGTGRPRKPPRLTARRCDAPPGPLPYPAKPIVRRVSAAAGAAMSAMTRAAASGFAARVVTAAV